MMRLRRLASAGLVVFLLVAFPRRALADNCSALSDCYGQIAAAVLVAVLIALAIAIALELAAAAAAAEAAAAEAAALEAAAAEAAAAEAAAAEIAAAEAAAAEAAAGEAAATEAAEAAGNVLKFGENDLVYGPSARGALRELAEESGGKLLTDLPKPPDMSWTEFSLQTLDEAAASGRGVRFDLTNMADVEGALAQSG